MNTFALIENKREQDEQLQICKHEFPFTIVNKIDVNIMDTSWMTEREKIIFDIFKHECNRHMTKVEIARLLGIPESMCFHVTNKNPKFRYLFNLLKNEVIEYPWMKKTQHKIWDYKSS